MSDPDFVEGGPSAIETSADGRTSTLTLAMPYDESDSRVEGAIEHLRNDLVPPAFDGVDAEHAVGGGAAESLDFSNRLGDYLPIVVGFVLLLTLLMMASRSAACRSRWCPPGSTWRRWPWRSA